MRPSAFELLIVSTILLNSVDEVPMTKLSLQTCQQCILSENLLIAHESWSSPFQHIPLACPSLTSEPRYSSGVNTPWVLLSEPIAQAPNSNGLNSHIVAFSAITVSPGSRLNHESQQEDLSRQGHPTHSAAMIIGMGSEPLLRAGTSEDNWERVRLGELSR